VSRRTERPSKGQRTRQRIVEQAAVLFNTRGVAGASMADISEATGLEKGGVYNHFATKEELAVAAFEYGAGIVLGRIDRALRSGDSAVGKLRAVLDLYREATLTYVTGGCPVMNTAIEADDTSPDMRRRARAAFDQWTRWVVEIVEAGVASGELRPVDPRAVATITVANIEGGVMLSRLYGSRGPLRNVLDHLETYLESLVADVPSRRV
jgi:AcrR family transcriptional regulator